MQLTPQDHWTLLWNLTWSVCVSSCREKRKNWPAESPLLCVRGWLVPRYFSIHLHLHTHRHWAGAWALCASIWIRNPGAGVDVSVNTMAFMPMWNQLPEWGAAQTEGIVMYVTCLIWAMYVIYQVGKDKNVEDGTNNTLSRHDLRQGSPASRI